MKLSSFIFWACAVSACVNQTKQSADAFPSRKRKTRKTQFPILAKCNPVETTPLVEEFLRQNRSILLIVQTITNSRGNLCHGRRYDWREGLGQCLAQMTQLRVVVQNNDGSCADCRTLNSTNCDLGPPPAYIVVLGGGEDTGKTDKSLRLHCTGEYCRSNGEPILLGLGHFPPYDYRGACDVYAHNRRGDVIFSGLLSTAVQPPVQISWFPMLNPHSEQRALWEESVFFAIEPNSNGSLPALPERRNRKERLYPPELSDRTDSDYQFLQQFLIPTFIENGRIRIDYVRDDAFAKPLLFADMEHELYAATQEDACKQRERFFIYAGHYRSTKGQLLFLKKLKPDTLGSYSIEMYGSRPTNYTAGINGVVDDWNEIQIEISKSKWRGRIIVHDVRVSHLYILQRMAVASGLIHYATGDRNPRVLYEALFFGLPIFVTVQSMPYIGLQCNKFVHLTDADYDAELMNSDFSAFVKMLENNRRYTRRGVKQNLQESIRTYVESNLEVSKVYQNLCKRFGLCKVSDENGYDPFAPWITSRKSKCLKQPLWRFENWRRVRWNVSGPLKYEMNISKRRCTESIWNTGKNCQPNCFDLSTLDRKQDEIRPWWLPNFMSWMPTYGNTYEAPCPGFC